MKIVKADEAGLEEAAKTLLSGGIAIIPTDTVYGLAAHPAHPGAVERLYTAKGRDRAKPIAMLASGPQALTPLGFGLSGKAAELAASGWPGALTLVVDGEDGRVEGFRVPDCDWTRQLAAKCGGALRVTSANPSGAADAAAFADAVAGLDGLADIAVDGGDAAIGAPSEVVRVSRDGSIQVLRKRPRGI